MQHFRIPAAKKATEEEEVLYSRLFRSPDSLACLGPRVFQCWRVSVASEAAADSQLTG